jgi:hypothetical protein
LEWLESRANTPLQATLSDFAATVVRGSTPDSSAAPRVARVRPGPVGSATAAGIGWRIWEGAS